jgi:hypothetical protein
MVRSPRWVLVLATVVALGCGRSPERIAADRQAVESLLADYARLMSEAYTSGDTAALARVATGREVARVASRIRELADQGRGLRPVLKRQVVESVESYSATGATATTIETWDLRVVALGSETTVLDSPGQENRLVYSLVREGGRWWVLSRLLKSSSEAP